MDVLEVFHELLFTSSSQKQIAPRVYARIILADITTVVCVLWDQLQPVKYAIPHAVRDLLDIRISEKRVSRRRAETPSQTKTRDTMGQNTVQLFFLIIL